jgi:hypothetical protein
MKLAILLLVVAASTANLPLAIVATAAGILAVKRSNCDTINGSPQGNHP